jgi:hypothetical protein
MICKHVSVDSTLMQTITIRELDNIRYANYTDKNASSFIHDKTFALNRVVGMTEDGKFGSLLLELEQSNGFKPYLFDFKKSEDFKNKDHQSLTREFERWIHERNNLARQINERKRVESDPSNNPTKKEKGKAPQGANPSPAAANGPKGKGEKGKDKGGKGRGNGGGGKPKGPGGGKGKSDGKKGDKGKGSGGQGAKSRESSPKKSSSQPKVQKPPKDPDAICAWHQTQHGAPGCDFGDACLYKHSKVSEDVYAKMFKPWERSRSRSRSPSKTRAKGKAKSKGKPATASTPTQASSTVRIVNANNNVNIAHNWGNTCRAGKDCEAYERGECHKIHYDIETARQLVARDSGRNAPGSPRPPDNPSME